MANPESKRLAVDVVARVDKLEREMKKASRVANDNFRRMETRGQQFQQRMAGIGRAAFAPFAAGALAALAPIAIFNRALNTISDASRLVKVAERVGLTTDAFQQLSHGFKLAGVEQTQFENGMQQFAEKLGEAATRGNRLAEILEANGVALRDSNGQMRTQESLLRDYARLIKNAASEQEQLLLATEAFGTRAGREFVTALKGGEQAIDDMIRTTNEAGGVIDRELLDKAQELDDRFANMWRRFDVNAKSAILTAITALDDLMAKATEVGNHSFFRRLAENMPTFGGAELTWLDPDLARAHGQKLGPDARIRDAFGAAVGDQISEADAALITELQKRYGAVANQAATTVLPGSKESTGSGGRNAAAAAAIREAEAVLRVIEALEHERSLIGMSDVEKAKANALRQAGAAATAEQRAEIEMLIEAIYRETEALDKANAAMDEMRELGRNVMGGFVSDLVRGTSAADALTDALSRVADQLINIAMNSLFSGGGGALLGRVGPLGLMPANDNTNARRAA